MSMFQRATKKQARLRMALLGPAGSGKTYSALSIGRALVGPIGRIALMDTEHASAAKYADLFTFDQVAPERFDVDTYIEVIEAAGADGYDLLILDSLSHAWAGKGGLLEFVDNFAKRNSGNSFGAWRDATPKHNNLVEAMLACRCHLIVTMRVKMDHVIEKDERTGKNIVRKMGLQPVQRDGLEYEFDVVGDLTPENDLSISKTRCPALKEALFHEPGEDIAGILRTWLGSGEAADAPPPLAFVAARTVEQPARPATNGATHHPEAPPRPTPPPLAEPILATTAQVRAIYGIGRDNAGLNEVEIDERSTALFGTVPAELTRKQASDLILALKGESESKPVPPPDKPAPPTARGSGLTREALNQLYDREYDKALALPVAAKQRLPTWAESYLQQELDGLRNRIRAAEDNAARAVAQ